MCCNACGLFFKHHGHHRPLKSREPMLEKAPQVLVEVDEPALHEGSNGALNYTKDFARNVTQSFVQTTKPRQLSLPGTQSEMYMHSPRTQSPVPLAPAAAPTRGRVVTPPPMVLSVTAPSLDDATMAFFLSSSLPVSAAGSPFLAARAPPALAFAPLNHPNPMGMMTAGSVQPMASFQDLLWGMQTSQF
ncbi:hypothetical protein BC830DRAFT_764802 [Chytriomyces sp. MP71]|nr:hypothetical protein BC830DRAFT_764802 [Chytriomyces sp. MP71]